MPDIKVDKPMDMSQGVRIIEEKKLEQERIELELQGQNKADN